MLCSIENACEINQPRLSSTHQKEFLHSNPCTAWLVCVSSRMQFFNSDQPVALTIAGSDSGGGAGIQADLKTFAAIGVFGTTAITCITAQTPSEVTAIEAVDPELVRQQIRAVSNGFPIAAAKTGMLYSAEIIKAVAQADINHGIPILVVDPVMVAASGARLLKSDAVEALGHELLPKARVVTPNLPEAEILCGYPISNRDDLGRAARTIGEKFDIACVVKGGHLAGDDVYDVLFEDGDVRYFARPRVPANETHGCGCMFSAALTAYLAQGELLSDAVRSAKELVSRALETAPRIGHHYPLNFSASLPVPS